MTISTSNPPSARPGCTRRAPRFGRHHYGYEVMHETKRITTEQLTAIAAGLADVPPPAPLFSTTDALLQIKDRLVSMREDGHSNASIAAALGETGLHVSGRQIARAMREPRKTPNAARKAPTKLKSKRIDALREARSAVNDELSDLGQEHQPQEPLTQHQEPTDWQSIDNGAANSV